MKLDIRIREKTRIVELERDGASWRVRLDRQARDAHAVEIAPGIYSVLLDGRPHDVCITPAPDGALTIQTGAQEFRAEVLDPRAWQGRKHGALEAEGRQPVAAPMPGKIVRVLVQAGEEIAAGQGLLVVEAMKMQNEICSPKSGVVEKILVREGQAVNTGDVLAWVS